DLAMLEQKRHFVRAHLEYAAAAPRLSVGRVPAESRIEEAGVVPPELTGTCVIGQHLRGVFRWHGDRLLGHEYVELIRNQGERILPVKAHGLPEVERIVVAPLQVDALGVLLRAPTDQGIVRAG